jgi:hypothetical protein
MASDAPADVDHHRVSFFIFGHLLFLLVYMPAPIRAPIYYSNVVAIILLFHAFLARK